MTHSVAFWSHGPIDFHGRSCAGRIAPSIITSALMEDPPVTGKFQESLWSVQLWQIGLSIWTCLVVWVMFNTSTAILSLIPGEKWECMNSVQCTLRASNPPEMGDTKGPGDWSPMIKWWVGEISLLDLLVSVYQAQSRCYSSQVFAFS